MAEWKQWLLTSVATEYSNKGLANADFYYVAGKEGISEEALNLRFPNKKELRIPAFRYIPLKDASLKVLLETSDKPAIVFRLREIEYDNGKKEMF